MSIETNRMLLKNYTIEDFEHYWLLKSTDKVWQYSTFLPYQNKSEAFVDFKKIIYSLNDNPYQFGALWTKEENQVLNTKTCKWNNHLKNCQHL